MKSLSNLPKPIIINNENLKSLSKENGINPNVEKIDASQGAETYKPDDGAYNDTTACRPPKRWADKSKGEMDRIIDNVYYIFKWSDKSKSFVVIYSEKLTV